MSPQAFYFGCWNQLGHYLHDVHGRTVWDVPPGCPWSFGLMDSTLLKNGRVPDNADGRVFWTCGGRSRGNLWFAFSWWDRSGDRRGNSNSGFYVSGFDHGQVGAAFKFACDAFPSIVERQAKPLVLQCQK